MWFDLISPCFFASCDLPIVVSQTPRLAEILCFKFSVLHVHSYHIPVYFLSLHCWNPPIQTSPYRITSLTNSCQRKPCVVCPAPAMLCSTAAQLLRRRKGSPQQGSALQTVFRRLRSSSLPPAATTTALPSSTEQMTMRTTRVRKRGHTLADPCSPHGHLFS